MSLRNRLLRHSQRDRDPVNNAGKLFVVFLTITANHNVVEDRIKQVSFVENSPRFIVVVLRSEAYQTEMIKPIPANMSGTIPQDVCEVGICEAESQKEQPFGCHAPNEVSEKGVVVKSGVACLRKRELLDRVVIFAV